MEAHNLYTNMHTHSYTNVYTCIQIHIHMHMHIHTYMHVCTHAYIHTYTHTHATCTYAHTQARLERQRCSKSREELMQMPEAPHVSFIQRNQPYLAPSMLGLHCTHILRHPYPSTPHPLFPTYPRTVRRPPMRSFTVPH